MLAAFVINVAVVNTPITCCGDTWAHSDITRTLYAGNLAEQLGCVKAGFCRVMRKIDLILKLFKDQNTGALL